MMQTNREAIDALRRPDRTETQQHLEAAALIAVHRLKAHQWSAGRQALYHAVNDLWTWRVLSETR